jgi:hypothetical protein
LLRLCPSRLVFVDREIVDAKYNFIGAYRTGNMGFFNSDEKEIVSEANGDSITESRLFEKSARVIQRLKSSPIIEHLTEDEQPHYLFSGPTTGLIIKTPGGEQALGPENPYHAFLLVTDQRVLFLAGQSNGDISVSFPFDQIKRVHLMTTPTKRKLRFETEAGMCAFHSSKKMAGEEATEATEYIRDRIPEDSSAVSRPTELDAKLETYNQEPNQTHKDTYIADSAGSTVTADRISTIAEMLNEGEEVVHMLRVPGVSHGPETDEKSISTKHTKTGTAAFTDERVVIKIPHQLADDQFVIRYHNIENVAYNLEGMIFPGRGFEITTAGEKYRLSIHYKIDDDEVREIVDWLDNRATEAKIDSDNSEPPESPRERLKKLESIWNEGLISKEEYEEKREQILEEL